MIILLSEGSSVANGKKYKGIVIEVKYPDVGDLETGCAEAPTQIEKMGDEGGLNRMGWQ